MPSINVCMDFGSKKDHTEADGQKPQTKPDRDYWSCGTCFHHRKGKDLPICGQCEDGSQYTPSDDEAQEAHELAEDNAEGQQDQEESEEPDNGND